VESKVIGDFLVAVVAIRVHTQRKVLVQRQELSVVKSDSNDYVLEVENIRAYIS